ncbi:MAG: hypothetical protein ACYTGN_11495 [Planctomycetota bacterium]
MNVRTRECPLRSRCGGPEGRGRPLEAALASTADPVAYALGIGQTCPVPNAAPVALHSALHGDGVPHDWLEKVANRAELVSLTDSVLDAAGL